MSEVYPSFWMHPRGLGTGWDLRAVYHRHPAGILLALDQLPACGMDPSALFRPYPWDRPHPAGFDTGATRIPAGSDTGAARIPAGSDTGTARIPAASTLGPPASLRAPTLGPPASLRAPILGPPASLRAPTSMELLEDDHIVVDGVDETSTGNQF